MSRGVDPSGLDWGLHLQLVFDTGVQNTGIIPFVVSDLRSHLYPSLLAVDVAEKEREQADEVGRRLGTLGCAPSPVLGSQQARGESAYAPGTLRGCGCWPYVYTIF